MIVVLPHFFLAVKPWVFHGCNMMLGQLLLGWRRHTKTSRRKLASLIGIDHVTLSRIEEGESGSISLDNLNKIIRWIFHT